MPGRLRKLLLPFVAAFTILTSVAVSGAQQVNMTLTYGGKSHAYSAPAIEIVINGEKITNYDVPPVIINDRTLVPARVIFEKLGGEVFWNENTKEIYITCRDQVVVLQIDNNKGSRNGVEFSMDVPAMIINDRTMIPARAVAEAVGCYVGWNDASRTVTIDDEAPKPDPEPNPDPEPEKPEENGNSSNQPDVPSAGTIFDVTEVIAPQDAEADQVFTIVASGPISYFNKFVVGDNRLAVDIYDANMKLANTQMTVSNSAFVSSIRSSQFQVAPRYITRVVFDLSTSADYTVTQSEDKKKIYITFKENILDGVSLHSTDTSDEIRIQGGAASAVIMEEMGENTYSFTIQNSKMRDMSIPDVSDSNFISDLSIEHTSAGAIKILLETSELVEVTIESEEGRANIHLIRPTYQNITYNKGSGTITLHAEGEFSADEIGKKDDYLNLNYQFTLPGNFKDLFGYGQMHFSGGALSSLTLGEDARGNTTMTVKENDIYEFIITEDGDDIEIRAVNPKEVYPKIVVLDAGHGKSDPGSSGNGITEKDMNLDLVKRIYALLEADPSIKVYATRLDDSYPTNPQRAAMANRIADLFVSVHQNSNNNEKPNGTETLYMDHNNEKSGNLTSKIAAQFIQNYIVPALGTTDRGLKERPDLIVLNQTKIPAVLIETLFISNPEDAAKAKNEQTKDAFAQAVCSAIQDMFQQYPLR
ncbi:MAG: N-acetylmuramoyl-L-alanine amidase [Clostridiales bacterium]|nr:N-acetylmuramoyl-L-alanine amidase [Clostridiales bacterium]